MTSISTADYKRLYKTKPRAKRSKRPKVESPGEEKLAVELRALGIKFEREFKFCPDRKWKADFHLIGKMVLVEVEGGIWSNGRHTRGKGYLGDMEKYNAAQNLGYKVLRFSTEQVMSGMAVGQIEALIKLEVWEKG